ncbi:MULTISPECIES: dihydropteroate synthase [unclassified Herbaspirillum]|uniref:dihydropteroate synthase n=1 Tax=unclassified Herbaspirillum TaxID=2624150 RepID=UPI001153D79C|nr:MULTISPECIES: dihydropteroate synthase [unclassified Herbaspirillum]MBB5391770.1 dihydropteroate synthase [Herbaspirillum sp. SJZ102]TQK02985.1 dihydropteroate synthase [Herbaspirillum sp. SJZ130]TQK06627.1 dihydropteroate synthase [Herbaspirillum sp. SJZ106]TWC71144.1 dihydropteroate synthase [Herbaspirillum sp. SJZ099]
MTQAFLKCGRFRLPVQQGRRPLVMGILNVTPDSFSDGGRHNSLEFALSHAEQMIADGVDIIDIGGESTRPGIAPLSLQQELERVMPVIYALRDCGKPLSIDTYKPAVMREALLAEVDMINDISGFRAEGAIDAVKDSEAGLCVMHMQGQPQTMQQEPHYGDVVAEVEGFLRRQADKMMAAGVARERICIDPGFGFGKTLAHNLALLKNTRRMIGALDLPLLAGMSRKSMVGAVTGKPLEKRMAGSIGAALAAAQQGAMIIRVHDVAETVDALNMWQAGREEH